MSFAHFTFVNDTKLTPRGIGRSQRYFWKPVAYSGECVVGVVHFLEGYPFFDAFEVSVCYKFLDG